MDKVIKAVQLLTLILVSLVCLAYIWRQYYDYKRRQEAWDICAKWSYEDAKILLKANHWRFKSACSASSLSQAVVAPWMNRGSTPWEITLLSSNWTGMQIQQHAIDPTNPAGVTTGPAASPQNEALRVLKRSRPGNGCHIATNSELLLHRS